MVVTVSKDSSWAGSVKKLATLDQFGETIGEAV